MSMDRSMETAQLLARFKLQVKRTLAQTVDLEQLARDPAYARQRLAEIEDAAEDEDLLIMVVRLRDLLVPPAMGAPIEAAPLPPATEKKQTPETRRYLMGARAW